MSNLHCVPDCKHGRRSTGDMMRCCLCAIWYHEDCLGLKEEDRGVWPCPSCRRLNNRVEEMAKNITALMEMVSQMNQLLHTSNHKHKDEIQKMMEDKTKLEKENTDLRKNVADLNIQVNTLKWKSFRRSDKPNNALVGNSIIRDVSCEMLEDTEVVCSKENGIADVKKKMEDLSPGYDTITLAIGGHACATDPSSSADNIVNLYSSLIESAKNKCEKVTVSSIPPGLSNDTSQEKIDSINAGLLAVCNEKDSVNFIDVSPVFHLADGTVNDGYVLPDGVNITRSATNKLACKLSLKIKNKKEGVCKTYSRPSQMKMTPTFRGSIPASSNGSSIRSDSRQRTFRRIRSRSASPSQVRDSWCFNCGEPNHVKDHCRHSEALTCHQCHLKGHKSKFCELYSK